MNHAILPVTAAGHRVLTARVHALGELGEGTFEAYVSAYGVTFTEGGFFFRRKVRMRRGMFAESLAARDGKFPVMWEHDWDAGPIGHTTESEEQDKGLRQRGQLYLDGERARNVWRAMDAGAITEWSVAFYPRGHEVVDDGDDEVVEYTKAELLESTVALRGANPGAETVSVQSGHRQPVEVVINGVRYVADPYGLAAHTAIAPHGTDVIDIGWDRNDQVARIPNDAGASVLRRMFAWRDTDADPDTKAAYSMPHHNVVDGEPREAVVQGVRAALQRLPQSDIPRSEHDAVRRHLNRHLNDWNDRSEDSLVPGAERLLDRPSVRDLLRTQVA